MSNLLELMAAPFAACVVLVGIHAYLGMHVIQRKVIFVDLALAQIAALGATFGFLLGVGPHSSIGYLFSLGFAIVGAAIFALTRMRHERIPQEAIIGIVYAVALAAAILVADRAPEGSEHIKETLTGTLLWVRWPTILKTGVIYALIGLLHYVLRKRFFQISFNPEQAYAEGRSVRLWDFIFYVTFAFVITSSVAIAGVLVVFSFLVIPAVIATLVAERISIRLLVGWSVGLVACAVGLVASYRLDLPSGPSVVTSLGVALLIAGLLYSIWHAENRAGALLRVAGGVAGTVVLLAAVSLIITKGTALQVDHEHDWEHAGDTLLDEEHSADELLAALVGECDSDFACMRETLLTHEDWAEDVGASLVEGSEVERDQWMQILGGWDSPEGQQVLGYVVPAEADPLERLEGARLLMALGDTRGPAIALDLLSDATPPLVREESYEALVETAGRDFGYDPFATSEENAAAVERLREWASSPG